MPETDTTPDIAALTVQLLSAYLSNNTVAADDLAGLIRTTRSALMEEAVPAQKEAEAPTYTPAVSVRKSLSSPDHILSLIDGKPYKTLKRHLASHGLTPDQYRERYGLPATYPMVAPTFAARRREIAEQIGLGSSRKRAASADGAKAARPAVAPVSIEHAAPDAPAAAEVKVVPKRKATRKAAPTDAASITSAPITSASSEPAPQMGASPVELVAEKPKAAKPASTGKVPAKAAPAVKGATSTKKRVAGTAGSAVAPDVSPEETKPARKRRGKLGLFKEADTGAIEATDTKSTAAASAPAAKAEGKAPRARRMARTPKAAAPAAKTR